MARMRERIFAFSGAILFFLTSIALTVVVVVTAIQDSHKKPDVAASNAQNQSSCIRDNQTEEVLPVPDVYKADSVSELQKVELQAGSGEEAKVGDCLVMKYYGTLAKDGTLFDENFTKPTGFEFTLGQGQVIPGWDQGLVGMKVGGTRRLAIPSALAYGAQSPSDKVPANSDLVFVVKLLRIQK